MLSSYRAPYVQQNCDLKGTEYCAPRFMCSNYSARKLCESKFSVLDLQVNPIKPGLF